MVYANKRNQTQNKIIESFISLFRDMDISAITIKKICDEAGIHRSTFYHYYLDVYDLLEKLEDDVIEIMRREVAGVVLECRDFTVDDILRSITVIFREKKNLPALLIQKGSERFIRKVLLIMNDTIEDKRPDITKQELQMAELSLRYHLAAVAAVVNAWEKNPKGLSEDELLNGIARIATEGPVTVLRKNLFSQTYKSE